MVFNLALAANDASTSAGLMDFLPSILLFVVLIYFMIIRPQKKRQQNAKSLVESIGVGDKIQTIGGFIGEILEMEDDEFVILCDETRLRVKRSAVAIRLTEDVQESAPVVEDDDDNDDDNDYGIKDFEI